nr:hypothetical protein [Clostridium kluyveri]
MEKMCEVLDIKRSSYYDWLKRPITKRKRDNALLAVQIKRVHKQSSETYGARRITKVAQYCDRKVYISDGRITEDIRL